MQLPWLVLLSLAPAALSSSANDTLLWGAYRPNLYFGIRPRIPQSLLTGLMWFGTQDYTSVYQTRHACDQGDQLQSYTWTKYDAREGGIQVIKDAKNNVQITTEFLKVAGGDDGGNWAARIKGEPLDPLIPSRISTIFYLGLEGLGGLDMDTDEEENGLEGDEVKFTGSTPELDDFVFRIVDGPNNVSPSGGIHYEVFQNRAGKTHFLGQPVPAGSIWQAKEYIMQRLLQRAQEVVAPYRDPGAGVPDPSYILQLPDEVYSGSNLYAVQKIFDGEFQFDVFYESSSSNQKLSSSTLDEGIPALAAAFDQRFKRIFPIPSDYSSSRQDSLEAFSQAITSNLIGGVGYFYGTSIINEKFSYEWDEEDEGEDGLDNDGVRGPRLTEPKKLLTATPSRSFFPRGFYWDEGFHLLHIGAWDDDFGLEILKDWIDLIDENGWVAREQILGEEARSKVPAEFLTQVPNYANPPTLTVAITAFINRVKAASGPSDADLGMDFGMGASQTPFSVADSEPGSRSLSPEVATTFLKGIYKPLKRHYDWFRRTQRGQIKQYARKARSRTEAYRWRGRSGKHVLTSGMDDYPRGPPHAGELHLDLISWMALFSRTMREISEFIGETDDAISYSEIEKAILDNIEDLHWNEEKKMYCDLNVDDDDESYHVCHKGYLSLFPFMLALLPPDSPHLGATLDMVHDPEHLWSDYGLRSLSASHPEYGTGENYWKGPVWVQMNYLTLGALYNKYAVEDGPYKLRAQEIYRELRKNIVDNVFREYERTGYVWEQYDPNTGHVTLILTEKY
ncbi:glycoside hydrolase [Rhodocollybia butyracea]|uniref:Mannosyl-oligosaccharide glucosidase n=1 Tax=Rhodocollybia butyracea TaxID=206335 RepID=A0A9P5PJS9_9AGAR|nr:glycoside hydrolase [Rhodocollybia butyracea]